MLVLLTSNLTEVEPHVVWRPLAFSLLFALVVFGLLRLIVRDWQKAALLASLFLMLFFTYGHVYALLKEVRLAGMLLGRHRLLFPLWGILLIAGSFWILRKVRDFEAWTMILNLMLLFVLVFQVAQVGFYLYKEATTTLTLESDSGLKVEDADSLPDIYIIILDAYGRADALEQFYGFDNTPFLTELADMGFEIVPCARSNYQYTVLSIPSLLNMGYIEELTGGQVDKHTTRILLVDNLLRRSLKELGYTFVTFEIQVPWLQIQDSDVYYDFTSASHFNALKPFELMYLESTWGLAVTDTFAAQTQSMMAEMNLNSPNALKAELTLARFDAMEQAIQLDSPKFVYAHFLVPHLPHVFDIDGNLLEDIPDPKTGYVTQVQFINHRILDLIEQIQTQSDGEAVIVLQSDHNLEKEYRFLILNAIYFPEDRGELPIYSGMTPVNTFRMIFNQLFDAGYPILEDKFFESDGTWYNYWQVDDPDMLCTDQNP